MSLKAIHIVFIIASTLLSIFFGIWAVREFLGPEGGPEHLLYGVLSIAALVGLVFYGRYFLRKMKHIDL
jgi:heme A synthase